MNELSKKLIGIALSSTLIVSSMITNQCDVNAASKVKINKTKATINVGETVQLKVNGAKNVKWVTSNKKVATVSSKGKVKGVKKGTATITAKVSKKKYKCKVTVKEKEKDVVTPTPNNPPSNETPTPTITPTQNPSPSGTIAPSPSISPTPTVEPPVDFNPTKEPIKEDETQISYCNIGERYKSKNGLDVCVNSIEVKEAGTNFYECTINYSIENNTDEVKQEPSFRVFDSENNNYGQFGSFGYIYPTGYEKDITYTFTITRRIKPTILELETDQMDTAMNYNFKLNPTELHWEIK